MTTTDTEGYRIISNRIRCRSCRDGIESFHRYDAKRCLCGACVVDGGTEQLDRNGRPDTYTEHSVLACRECGHQFPVGKPKHAAHCSKARAA